jgi:hypothetical protein
MAIFNSPDHGHRGSGSPILQHFSVFTDSSRFFSSPLPPAWHADTVPEVRSITAAPLRPYGRTTPCQNPLPRRCQMARPLRFRHRRLIAEVLSGEILQMRIPVSQNGFESPTRLPPRDNRKELMFLGRCALWCGRTDGLIRCFSPGGRFPASYNGYRMRPWRTRARTGCCQGAWGPNR